MSAPQQPLSAAPPNRFKTVEDYEKRRFVPYYALDLMGNPIVNPEWESAPYEEVFAWHRKVYSKITP